MITEKQAIARIRKAIMDVSADPKHLPTPDTHEGQFLIDIYEALENYDRMVRFSDVEPVKNDLHNRPIHSQRQ